MRLENLYDVCERIENGDTFVQWADIAELIPVCKVILDNLMEFAQYYEDENLAHAAVMNQRNAAVTLSNIFEELEYYTED